RTAWQRLALRRRRLHRRPLEELLVPFEEIGAAGADVADRLAELEPADSAGDGDLAEIEVAAERGRFLVRQIEPLRDLLRLAGQPVAPLFLLRPDEGLVADQQAGIENAVAQGLSAQHAPAFTP